MPVSHAVFDRSIRLLAGSAGTPPARAGLLETGIKVIDVMCPLLRGGTVAIAGELRAGTTVVTEELRQRLTGGTPDAPGEAGDDDQTPGEIQTFYYRSEDWAWTPERLAALTGVDVVIRLSADLGCLGIYPTVDPLSSRSRLLETGAVDGAHLEVAARIREAFRTFLAARDVTPAGVDERTLERARKLARFLAQPFYVTEPYTKRPGVSVRLAESLQVCREILDGVHDAVPAAAFYFAGGREDVLARAAGARRAP
jgi:F0F1-type ATP synthase beta subunit